MNMSAGVLAHRDEFIFVSFFDFVEITKSVLNSRDIRRWSRGGDCNRLCAFAQGHSVRSHIGVATAVAKLVSTLQNNRLESIWQHAVVVATDKRRVVALRADSDAQSLHDPEISVELAQDRDPILSLLQQAGSSPIVRGINRVCRVRRGAEREVV